MPPLLMLISLPAMLWTAPGGATNAADQIVRNEKNGEFLWKYYPPGALKRGEQGRVAFRLTIDPVGTISSCDVTESSGFPALDKETCEVMSLYAQVQPVRNQDGRAIRAAQQGFIVWKLPPGATRVADAPSGRTMPKPDQIICRKDITTGSLIATTKMCMTRSEWTRETANQKQHWEDMQGKGYSCKGDGMCGAGN
ncbi:energy transducer TonB [Sphingomonas sp. URHD0057]|uniref:energy transducer TonB n=1 Tax=Sphingomonas sp. URHD0057 TaxID=1380389 RepID=UPI000A4C53AE|nr:energy transducer TonB [Sphingomonas sp. URHD0057]